MEELVKTESRNQPTEQPSELNGSTLCGVVRSGVGHVWLKKWDAQLMAELFASFIVGLAMGGHMFSLSTGRDHLHCCKYLQ